MSDPQPTATDTHPGAAARADCAHAANTPRVTHADRALLRILEGYMRGRVSREKGYAYPSVVELAARAGVSIPTVKRRIRRLRAAGLLIVERPDRRYRNRYRLPAEPAAAPPAAPPAGPLAGITFDPPEGSLLTPRRDQNEPPEGSLLIRPSERIEEQNKEQTQQQQSAAAESKPIPNPNPSPLEALTAAGLPEEPARRYANSDAGGKCLLAAAYYAERSAQTPCTLGLLRDMLDRPAGYFHLDPAGNWQPPRDSMIYKSMRAAEKAVERREHQGLLRLQEQERQRLAAESAATSAAQVAADAAAWEQLSESDRRGIEHGVGRELPPSVTREAAYPNGTPTAYRLRCYAWMRRLQAAITQAAAWEALSDAERAAIDAEARKRFPLWAATADGLRSACLTVMQQRGQR